MRVVVFLILAFGFEWQVYAQCPSRVQIWEELNKTSDLEDNKRIIQNLIKLQQVCQRCKMDGDSTYAKILHVLGRTYWQEGNLQKGIECVKKSVAINSINKPESKRINLNASYFNLGCIYAQQGDLKNSIASFNKSIEIGKNYQERWFSVSDGYKQQANIYFQTGDYEKCIEAADLGYEFGDRIGDKEKMAGNLTEKAQALIALMRWQEAESELKKAEILLRNTADLSLIGFVFSKIASLYKHRKNYNLAIKSYSDAFRFFKKNDFRYGCAQSANDLGYLYQNDLKKYSQAIEQYTTALEYSDVAFVTARIYNNIGTVYSLQKDYEKAFSFYQKALITSPIGFDSENIVSNPPGKLIRIATSKEYLLSLIQDKADTWLDYAKHSGKDKTKLKNALSTYMLADTMVDYMRWEHTGSVTKLFWRDKTRAMYERAIETCYLLNDPDRAFHFFEKSRAVLLNDQLNELGANQLLTINDQEKEMTLKQKVTDLQNKLGEVENDEKITFRIRSDLSIAQQEQESFIRHIEKISPQYYAYKYDNRVPTVTEIRSKILTDDQTFVSYFVGDSAIYGLGISSHNIIVNKINLSEYNVNTSRFEKLIGNREAQNRNFGEFSSVSSRLYRLLLQPFHIAPNTRVIISPDGSFLPFEALRTSGPNSDYLVKKYAFSYTYSAGFLMKSLRSSNLGFTTKYFLGLAPVRFASNLSQAALPGSDIALKTIDKFFLFSKTLTGPEASRSAFIKESPDYRIVQLLTHATADSAVIVPTLYFADSTLKLNELSATGKSNTELLILSACQTGIGKNQRGEGVFSLARGFAGMGIPSTLTTLWSIENESVYGLTKLFYAELEKGVALDLALQHAQIEWLKTASPSNRLPYAWAGMVLIGNNEPVSLGISKRIAYVFIAGLAMLFVFLIFYFKKRFLSVKN